MLDIMLGIRHHHSLWRCPNVLRIGYTILGQFTSPLGGGTFNGFVKLHVDDVFDSESTLGVFYLEAYMHITMSVWCEQSDMVIMSIESSLKTPIN